MSSPPTTKDSLLDKATILSHSIAVIVGFNPTNPTRALTTILASLFLMSSFKPSSPT